MTTYGGKVGGFCWQWCNQQMSSPHAYDSASTPMMPMVIRMACRCRRMASQYATLTEAAR
jgi:hypothetical protein